MLRTWLEAMKRGGPQDSLLTLITGKNLNLLFHEPVHWFEIHANIHSISQSPNNELFTFSDKVRSQEKTRDNYLQVGRLMV